MILLMLSWYLMGLVSSAVYFAFTPGWGNKGKVHLYFEFSFMFAVFGPFSVLMAFKNLHFRLHY